MNDCQQLLSDFYGTIEEGLKEKLGPVLFQFPARIAYNEEFLQRITQNINTSFINIVEFRQADWWNQHVINVLSNYNISFCGISISNLPDEIVANTSTLYYRFHGISKLYFSQYSEIEIMDFAVELKKKAIDKTVYVFFNNTATMAAIHNAFELKNFLGD